MTTPGYGNDLDDLTDEARERHLAQVERAFQDRIDALERANADLQERIDLYESGDDPDDDDDHQQQPAATQQPQPGEVDFDAQIAAAEAAGHSRAAVIWKLARLNARTAPPATASVGAIVEPAAEPDARAQLRASLAEKLAPMPKLDPATGLPPEGSA